jgi:ABC-type amino acid transport substrate-binding protein
MRYLLAILILGLIFSSLPQGTAQQADYSLSDSVDTLEASSLDPTLGIGKRTQKIKVGIELSEPFINIEEMEISGISIDLWEDIAEELKVDFEYIVYDDFSKMLTDVGKGEVDISINPLTVTGERLQEMDFTQPFFITNLAIALKKPDDGPVLRFLKNMFSWNFIAAISVLSIIILIFGGLVWLFERKRNTEQFGNNARGLWDSFWWSAVTMTTVGYGDRAPKTTGGRLVAIVWMFAALIIISGYTASIASSLTVNELSLKINSVDDLHKVKIVTVKGSSSETYLQLNKLKYTVVADAKEGMEMIAQKEADALVHDEPIMRYTMNVMNLDDQITLAPAKFFTQYYGFALPKNSPHLASINLALVREIKTMDWRTTLGKYQLD